MDTTEQSTWDILKLRIEEDGNRRPLLVVYDEAHNLSDQQTQLLMELEPDGFFLASATMRLPAKLETELQLLRQAHGDDGLVTTIDGKAVAESGLIKSAVVLRGYGSPMEETVTELVESLRQREREAAQYGLPGRPKAIYVANTNIVESDAYRRDDPKRPFTEREAPPILIWRHLRRLGVKAKDIAVYCTLAFHSDYPPPDDFVLFRGGDKDYSEFMAGNFQHIIFNLTLQEGWDDPYCYFAYIDKSMGSRVQIEQIVGRLLRQPGARHYGAADLNAAHMFVRVDDPKVFSEVVDAVDAKLAREAPRTRVYTSPPGKAQPVTVEAQGTFTVPGTALDASRAVRPITQVLARMNDYRHDDGANTQSRGSRAVVRRVVGGNREDNTIKWEEYEHSAVVSARWVFGREVRRRDRRALDVAPTSDGKFDAMVGIGSNAEAHVVATAKEIVDLYLSEVVMRQKKVDPFLVGGVLVHPDEAVTFRNAVHERYDDLRPSELQFARALDHTGLTWCRNISQSGYAIPLPSAGETRNFYPDFFVWKDSAVIAIDTKGGHILPEALTRKLLNILVPAGASPRLLVRFVSEGTYNDKAERVARDGYSVWGFSAVGERRVWGHPDLDAAISRVLTVD